MISPALLVSQPSEHLARGRAGVADEVGQRQDAALAQHVGSPAWGRLEAPLAEEQRALVYGAFAAGARPGRHPVVLDAPVARLRAPAMAMARPARASSVTVRGV